MTTNFDSFAHQRRDGQLSPRVTHIQAILNGARGSEHAALLRPQRKALEWARQDREAARRLREQAKLAQQQINTLLYGGGHQEATVVAVGLIAETPKPLLDLANSLFSPSERKEVLPQHALLFFALALLAVIAFSCSSNISSNPSALSLPNTPTLTPEDDMANQPTDIATVQSIPETVPPTPNPSPTATEGVPFGGPITPEFIAQMLKAVDVDATNVENIIAGETVEWKANATVNGETALVEAKLIDGELHIIVDDIDKGTQSTSSGSAVVETATPAPGVYCTTDINVRNGPGTAFDILKACAAGTNFPADQIEGVVNTPDQNVKQWLVLAGEPKQYIAVIPGALDIVGIDPTKLAEQPAPEATEAATVAPSPETTTQIESGELAALKEQVASWLENGLADIDQDSQFYFFGEPLEVGGYGIRPDPLQSTNANFYAKLLGLIEVDSHKVAFFGLVDSTNTPFVLASSLGNVDNMGERIGVNLATTDDIGVANNTTPERVETTVASHLLEPLVGKMAAASIFYTQINLDTVNIPPERLELINRLWLTLPEAGLLQSILYGDLNLDQVVSSGLLPSSIIIDPARLQKEIDYDKIPAMVELIAIK